MARRIQSQRSSLGIATVTALAALAAAACCLLASMRATSAEAKPRVEHYRLTRGADNALRYAASCCNQGNLGGTEHKALGRILFAVWLDERSPEKAVLHLLDFDVSEYSGKEMLTRYKKKDIVGKAVRFAFDARGSDSFSLELPKDASEGLKQVGDGLSWDILPLIFPRLPDDFPAKKGFSWKRVIKSKKAHNAALTRWTITSTDLPLKWNPVIAMETQARSRQAPKGVSRHRWQRWSVYYDPAAKMVRYATNESLDSRKVEPKSGDLVNYSNGAWVITELPRLGANER
jgi:hypothetical protein